MHSSLRGLNILQKVSMSLMGVLVVVTFVAANLHALLWQSSEWLVSTVLPAVVVQLTNEERSDISEAPLQRNSTLDAAAQLKAEHMAKNEYFAHYSPDGVSPWHWFDEAGYTYAYAGENLAIHFTDSSEVVEAWMTSPTHRQNIVNNHYIEIGVGTAKGEYEGYETVYVVQLFGAPAVAPAPTLAVASTPAPNSAPEMAQVVEGEASTSVLVTNEPEATGLATLDKSEVSEPMVSEDLTNKESQVLSNQIIELEGVEVTSESEAVLEKTEVETAVLTTEPEPKTEIASEPVAPTEETIETKTEPVLVEKISPNDVIIINSSLIATSSGLAVANITTQNNNHAGETRASIATKPNELLQFVYLVLGGIILILLSTSLVLDARRLRFVQVSYSLVLLFGMGSLWFVHSLLTTGAVII